MVVPGCARLEETSDECMEVGFGQGGPFDCSSLVLQATADVLGITVDDRLRRLRHTRQMVPLLEAVGEVERPLTGATPRDIGSLVFSRVLKPVPTLPVETYGSVPPRIIHVSILAGFTLSGQPLVIESAGSVGRVHGRVPPEPERPLERFMLSSSALARLVMEPTELDVTGSRLLVAA